jgi:hypothetical protein
LSAIPAHFAAGEPLIFRHDDPLPNAPKWFAAVEIIGLAADQDWLHKATKEIAKFWRNKRQHCETTVVL